MANIQASLLQELSYAADSYDIKDQLSVLFRREVVEDSQRIHDYHRLSDELTEGVKMRDEFMNETRMLVNYEEILECIEIMRRMQVDDIEKASRLMMMAREIQTKVHEKNHFIFNLREVVPKVDDVSLVDEVFDGAFGRDGEEDFVIREGMVVTYSSLKMLTKSCLGGMMVSLIFLEGLEEEA
nr:hypothetical protein [Tanacetum cinerariifolium]